MTAQDSLSYILGPFETAGIATKVIFNLNSITPLSLEWIESLVVGSTWSWIVGCTMQIRGI